MKKIEAVEKQTKEKNILLRLSRLLLKAGYITQEEQYQMEEKVRKELK